MLGWNLWGLHLHSMAQRDTAWRDALRTRPDRAAQHGTMEPSMSMTMQWMSLLNQTQLSCNHSIGTLEASALTLEALGTAIDII